MTVCTSLHNNSVDKAFKDVFLQYTIINYKTSEATSSGQYTFTYNLPSVEQLYRIWETHYKGAIQDIWNTHYEVLSQLGRSLPHYYISLET